MSKEAEILRKCVSCHDEHICQKSRKSGESCISGASVLQKVTVKEVLLLAILTRNISSNFFP